MVNEQKLIINVLLFTNLIINFKIITFISYEIMENRNWYRNFYKMSANGKSIGEVRAKND